MGIILFSLGLRILFILFRANPSAPFVSWICSVSNLFMTPFREIFPQATIGGTAQFDIAAFVVIIVYSILVYVFTWFVHWVPETGYMEQEHIEERHTHG